MARFRHDSVQDNDQAVAEPTDMRCAGACSMQAGECWECMLYCPTDGQCSRALEALDGGAAML